MGKGSTFGEFWSTTSLSLNHVSPNDTLISVASIAYIIRPIDLLPIGEMVGMLHFEKTALCTHRFILSPERDTEIQGNPLYSQLGSQSEISWLCYSPKTST